MFKALGIRDKEYQLGKTKIFIKHPKIVFRIEEERDDKIDQVATRLQLVGRSSCVASAGVDLLARVLAQTLGFVCMVKFF